MKKINSRNVVLSIIIPVYNSQNILPKLINSIFLLLALGLLVTISGIMVNEEINYPGIDGIHEISSNTMLALVLIHITGVIISSLLHRENLIGAMISGCKPNCEGETISRNFVWLGVTMVLLTALFWIWSFKEKIL